MRNAKRFPFIERRNQAGEANVFPCVPITLSYRDCVSQVVGLFLEEEKKNGYGGTLNRRGDFTYEELRQKAQEFLEGI